LRFLLPGSALELGVLRRLALVSHSRSVVLLFGESHSCARERERRSLLSQG